MNLKVNYRNFVRQLLPPHKRQPVRLDLLRSFIVPLQSLFDEFHAWREYSRMLINVNSQVGVLGEFLRRKYNAPGIRIDTYANGLLSVGLIQEGSVMWRDFGLENEDPEEMIYYQEVPLIHEMYEKFDGADFVVYIPYTVDINLIESEIEKYKQVLLKYIIIQE